MTGAILFAFVVYGYLPHAIFKASAERFIDLGRRKDATQVEEIFSALLPSALLHAQTLILLALLGWFTCGWLEMPPPDWRLLAGLSTDEGYPALGQRFSSEYGLWLPLTYLGAVGLVSAMNGLAFGRGILLGVGEEITIPKPGKLYSKFKLYGSTIAAWAWKLVYQEYLVSYFAWQVQQTFAFVKTKDGSLFHGQFIKYEKNTDGSLESIFLSNVSRFSRLKHREAIERGENPIRPMYGYLQIKWCEVADVNITVPGVIEDLYDSYEKQRKQHMSPHRGPLSQDNQEP